MKRAYRKTLLLRVNSNNPEPAIIERAAETLQRGGLVAFPTETVYGLGANAFNRVAVKKIFEAKGRPKSNPLIVHVASIKQAQRVCQVTKRARKLMDRFWPGPLTLVLPKTAELPLETTGGLETVGVRMPNHPVALALIKKARCPIAAPSANRSGSPSPTCAEHVMNDLGGRIDLILDAGPTIVGVESTVIDLTEELPLLLRPGGIPLETLRRVLKIEPVKARSKAARRSPGMRFRHYAPRAQLILVEPGEAEAVTRKYLRQGFRVGVMARRSIALEHPQLKTHRMPKKLPAYARSLFSALRGLDALGVEVIIAERVGERGLGRAILDRLRRAASRG